MADRAICVTIATQRSGTKALGNCFNSGVEFLSLGEVFHEGMTSPASFKKYSLGRNDFGDLFLSGASESLLDDYFAAILNLYKRIHFDFMYTNRSFMSPLWMESGVDSFIYNYFKTRQFAVIHLIRDPVDSFVSLIMANITGQFHQYNSAHSENIFTSSFELTDDIIQTTLNDYATYHRKILLERSIVKNAFLGYPYFSQIDYSDLFGSPGWLSDNARVVIADIVGVSCEDTLQMIPCSIFRSDYQCNSDARTGCSYPSPRDILKELIRNKSGSSNAL